MVVSTLIFYIKRKSGTYHPQPFWKSRVTVAQVIGEALRLPGPRGVTLGFIWQYSQGSLASFGMLFPLNLASSV